MRGTTSSERRQIFEKRGPMIQKGLDRHVLCVEPCATGLR